MAGERRPVFRRKLAIVVPTKTTCTVFKTPSMLSIVGFFAVSLKEVKETLYIRREKNLQRAKRC